jgi:hypothetical protein
MRCTYERNELFRLGPACKRLGKHFIDRTESRPCKNKQDPVLDAGDW